MVETETESVVACFSITIVHDNDFDDKNNYNIKIFYFTKTQINSINATFNYLKRMSMTSTQEKLLFTPGQYSL